jgi:hypothetical protein
MVGPLMKNCNCEIQQRFASARGVRVPVPHVIEVGKLTEVSVDTATSFADR